MILQAYAVFEEGQDFGLERLRDLRASERIRVDREVIHGGPAVELLVVPPHIVPIAPGPTLHRLRSLMAVGTRQSRLPHRLRDHEAVPILHH